MEIAVPVPVPVPGSSCTSPWSAIGVGVPFFFFLGGASEHTADLSGYSALQKPECRARVQFMNLARGVRWLGLWRLFPKARDSEIRHDAINGGGVHT
jgi:hypothetical protein